MEGKRGSVVHTTRQRVKNGKKKMREKGKKKNLDRNNSSRRFTRVPCNKNKP